MVDVKTPKQLALNVQLRDEATFLNFYNGPNLTLVNVLKGDYFNKQLSPYPEKNQEEQFIFIYGEPGVGCTHLLKAVNSAILDSQRRSIYLSMEELIHVPSYVFEDMENFHTVCIDDIGLIAGIPEWELAFFNLFNKLRDAGIRLIVAAENAPRQLGIQLKDLYSRLTWGVVFQVQPLSDCDKVNALTMRADSRGLSLSSDVAQYILHRSSRDMSQLYALLYRLDAASLVNQRRLTIPFVKQIMNW